MNGKKIKLIRELIFRKDKERLAKKYKTLDGGQVVSSIYDNVYEEAKKDCRHMTMKQIRKHLAPTKIGGLRDK
jgi:hypothetical protein